MEDDKPWTVFCSVVAMDTTNIYYRVCSSCEKTLPDNINNCNYCHFKSSNSSRSKLLYRILLSIASEDEVFVVILFDRAAKVLIGCSADEFIKFMNLNQSADFDDVGRVLEGEMFEMKLSKPKNGNAQHLRAVMVSPLRSGFVPVIQSLKKLYNHS